MLPELEELLEILDQNKDELAESRRLYDILLAGRQPSRIVISPGTRDYGFYLPHLGVAGEDYFNDADTALRTELKTLSWRLREFPEEDVSDVSIGIHRESNSVVASAFSDVRLRSDVVGGYMIVPLLESISDVRKLKVPRPEDIPAVNRVVEFGDHFLSHLDGHVAIRVPVPIMPYSDAAMIRGDTQFVYDIIDHPHEAKALLEIATETQIRVLKYLRQRLGLSEPDATGIADDATSYLSPGLFEEFAVPYEQMAAEALSKTGRIENIHICGPSMHLLEVIKRELNPQSMLISYFGSIAQASPIMGRTALRGSVNPSVVKEGTRQEIREHILESLAQGSQHEPYYFASGTECWLLGTPVENVRYVYSVVKEYDRQRGASER